MVEKWNQYQDGARQEKGPWPRLGFGFGRAWLAPKGNRSLVQSMDWIVCEFLGVDNRGLRAWRSLVVLAACFCIGFFISRFDNVLKRRDFRSLGGDDDNEDDVSVGNEIFASTSFSEKMARGLAVGGSWTDSL